MHEGSAENFNIGHTEFALYTISSELQNQPPELITKSVEGPHNQLLVKQLKYEDPEGDQVVFSIVISPKHGNTEIKSHHIHWLQPHIVTSIYTFGVVQVFNLYCTSEMFILILSLILYAIKYTFVQGHYFVNSMF